MNANQTITATKDRKAVLSTLWIFAMFNYLYCDLMSLMDPELLRQYMTGNAGGIPITPGFLLAAAVLMEIPIAMILLSSVLNYPANRWANIIAGFIMTVVQLSTLFFGSAPTIYYIFFSILEIACTAFVIWYAWTWRNAETG